MPWEDVSPDPVVTPEESAEGGKWVDVQEPQGQWVDVPPDWLPEGWVGPAPSKPIEELGAIAEPYINVTSKEGRAGLIEQIIPKSTKDIPFAGDFIAAAEAGKVLLTARKIEDGEQPSDKELLDFNTYLANQKRTEEETFMGSVGKTIRESIRMRAEIMGIVGAEYLTAGAAPALEGKIGSQVAIKAAKTKVDDIVTKIVTKAAGKAAGRIAGKTAGFVAATNTQGLIWDALRPGAIPKNVQERRLQQALAGEDDDFKKAFVMGLLDTHIEHVSEASGEYLGSAVNRLIGKMPGVQALKKNISEKFIVQSIMKRFNVTKAKDVNRIFRNMGFDGYVNEIYEERYGGFLRGLFGVDSEGGLKSALEKTFPRWRNFGVEAVAFAVPGVTRHALSYGGAAATGSLMPHAKAVNEEVASRMLAPFQTEAEIEENTAEFTKRMEEQSRNPWYQGIRAMEWAFGKRTPGSVENILERLKIRGVYEAYHNAEDEKAGTGNEAVRDYLANKVRGIKVVETEEQRDKLIEQAEAGELVGAFKNDKFEILAKKSAFDKEGFKELAQETNVGLLTDIVDHDTVIVGTITPDTISDPLAVQRLFNTKDSEETEDLHGMLNKIMNSPDFGAEVQMAVPTLYTGTAQDFKEVGYNVPEGTTVYEMRDGKPVYAIYLGALNDTVEGVLVINPNSRTTDLVEDSLEYKFKEQGGQGLTMEAAQWNADTNKKIKEKLADKETSKQDRADLEKIQGFNQFERFIKSYMYSRMGYEGTGINAPFNRIDELGLEMGPGVDAYMRTRVGNFLNTISRASLKPVRGERQAEVRELVTSREKGAVAKARTITAEAAAEAPLVKLEEALNQDMRKKENRDAVIAEMDEIERQGRTFSLQDAILFDGLKKAVETNDIKDIEAFSKTFRNTFFIKPETTERPPQPPEKPRTVSRVGGEARTEAGGSLRDDLEQPQPEFTQPAIDIKEARKPEIFDRLPKWLQDNITKPAVRKGIFGSELEMEEAVAFLKPIIESDPKAKTVDAEDIKSTLMWVRRGALPGDRITTARTQVESESRIREALDAPAIQQSETAQQELSEDEENQDQIEISGAEQTETAGGTGLSRDYAETTGIRFAESLSPLSGRIGSNVEHIETVGMGAIADMVTDLAAFMKSKGDTVTVGSNNKYPMQSFQIDRWSNRWTDQDGNTKSPVLTWNIQYQQPHNRNMKAIFDPVIDAQGVLMVTDQSLEVQLGLPMQRLANAAQTGRYSSGKVIPNRDGTYDTSEAIASMDRPIAETDLISSTTGEQALQKSQRAALLPLTEEDIQNNTALELGQRIRDWMVRNRIRRLVIAGLDTVRTDSNGVDKVVKPFWIGKLDTAIKAAMNMQVSGADVVTLPSQELTSLSDLTLEEQSAQAQRQTERDIGDISFSLSFADDILRLENKQLTIPSNKNKTIGKALGFGTDLKMSYNDLVSENLVDENLINNTWQFKNKTIQLAHIEKERAVRSLRDIAKDVTSFSLQEKAKNISTSFDTLPKINESSYSLIAASEIPVLFHSTESIIEQGFDPSFISGARGVGEGATAFGWGFYFTEVPDIRDSYMSDALRRAGQANIYAIKLKGKKEFKFLDWDDPITKEQSEQFNIPIGESQNRVEGSPTQPQMVTDYFPTTGRDIYMMLANDPAFVEDSNIKNLKEAASNFLLESGYDGIRYQAAGFRKGDRDPKYNYVIFDPKIIDLRYAGPAKAVPLSQHDRAVIIKQIRESDTQIALADEEISRAISQRKEIIERLKNGDSIRDTEYGQRHYGFEATTFEATTEYTLDGDTVIALNLDEGSYDPMSIDDAADDLSRVDIIMAEHQDLVDERKMLEKKLVNADSPVTSAELTQSFGSRVTPSPEEISRAFRDLPITERNEVTFSLQDKIDRIQNDVERGGGTLIQSEWDAIINARKSIREGLPVTQEDEAIINQAFENMIASMNSALQSELDTEVSFSLHADIYTAVKDFHLNNLTADERLSWPKKITRALQGDLGEFRAVSRFVDKKFRETETYENFAKASHAAKRRASEQGELPADEQIDFDFGDDTLSMNVVDNMVFNMDPVMWGGQKGLHDLFLAGSRKMRTDLFLSNSVADGWRRKIEADAGKLRQRKLPPGHVERAKNLLTALKFILDNPKETHIITGIERGPGGQVVRVTGPQIDPIIAEWDKLRPEGMPSAEELLNEIRTEFEAKRQEANEIVQEMSEDEWIRYVKNYVNRTYRAQNRELRDQTTAKIIEESKHAKQRKFDTFREAAMKKGLVPADVDATKSYQNWAQNVWVAARNKIVLSHGSLIREVDGSPVLIPVREGEASKLGTAIPDSVAKKTLNNLALFANEKVDESADPFKEISRLTAELPMEQLGYERMDSPYTDDISYFWVKKGTASNVMKMMVGRGWDSPFARFIERYNAYTKWAQLQMSFFHPFSLVESLVASGGMTLKNPVFHPIKTFQELQRLKRDVEQNPEKYSQWINAGMMVDWGNPDITAGLINKDIQRGIDLLDDSDAYLAKVVKPGLQAFQNYKNFVDKFLWHTVHPTMKLYVAENIKAYIEDQQGSPLTEQQYEDIARFVNNALGGQEWDQYVWGTPKAKQMLHALFLAPDWTLSAANVAGITSWFPGLKGVVRPNLSKLETSVMAKRYWPAMTAIVLAGIPNLIQFGIYSATAAAGTLEDDDEPFTFLNERGRKTWIDITPLVRQLPGYQGGASGKRRVYMRWGKQAYEVFEGWVQKFGQTALNKSSVAVRTAFEQATGYNTGMMKMPFKGEGYLGIINAQGSLFDSRAGAIGQKVIPFSVLALLQERPSTFFAPAKRGASFGGTVMDMQKALEAYADPGVWEKISGSPVLSDNLEELMPAIIDAGQRNGVDTELALEQAVSRTRSKYYKEFFKHLNSGKNPKKLEQLSQSIIRLNGEIDQLHSSMGSRLEQVSRFYDIDMEVAAEEAFLKGEDALYRDLP